MRKLFFIFVLISFEAAALVSVDDCLKDAQLFGNHKHPVSPLQECRELIRTHPERKEVATTDGKYRLFGYGNMLYVDGPEGSALLAGDQTRLNFIETIWVDQVNKRIFVLQGTVLLTFDLEFIGNVNPLKMTSSPALKGLKDLRLYPGQNLISLTYMNGSQKKMNADAEIRVLSSKKTLRIWEDSP